MIKPVRRLSAWQRHEQRRNRHFLTVRRAVQRALNRQFAPVLAALRLGLMPTDSLVLEDEVRAIYRGIYILVGRDFAEFTYQQLVLIKAPDPERQTFFVRAMERFALTETAARIAGITETSKAFVRTVLAKATAEGWGIEKIGRAMRQGWNVLTRRRAVVIARTELTSAAAQGALAGARYARRTFDLKLEKGWLPRIDGRERESHRNAKGQWVGQEDSFTVGGYQMNAPGDTSQGAPVGEVVNCRCSVIFRRARS